MKYKNITGKAINLKINKEWITIASNEVVELDSQFEGLEEVVEKKVEAVKTVTKKRMFVKKK